MVNKTLRETGKWDDPWIQAVGSLFLGERLRQWTPVTWPKKKSGMDKIPEIGSIFCMFWRIGGFFVFR